MKRVLSCAIIVVSLPQQLIRHMVWKILYDYNTNLLLYSMIKKEIVNEITFIFVDMIIKIII
jgi:hypothetical protein